MDGTTEPTSHRVRMTPTQRVVDKLDRGLATHGLAAAVVGEITAPGFDGAQWRLVVSDGAATERVDVTLPGAYGGLPGMRADHGALERTVEGFRRELPPGERLAALVAASPLTVRGAHGEL